MTVGFSTTVGKVSWTGNLDLFTSVEKDHCEIPTFDDMEVSLLEGNWLSIINQLRIKNLHHFRTLLHESFVLDGEEIEWQAMTTSLGVEAAVNDFDFRHLGFGITHVESVIIHWVFPWVVLMMVFVVISFWSLGELVQVIQFG